MCFFFFFQAEDGIRDGTVTGVQTCALPIYGRSVRRAARPVRQARGDLAPGAGAVESASVRGGDSRQRPADREGSSERRFALTQRATTSTAAGITIPSERIIAATRPTKFRHACLNASPITLEPARPTTGSGSCT